MHAAPRRFWRRSRPLSDAPAPSGTQMGKAPKLCPGTVGRSFPRRSTPHHPAAGGTSPGISLNRQFAGIQASEARQAVGRPPVVKGSGSVGMWSTCKVVHHVHAVGALVHQAEQAHPLHARSRGVWGGRTCSAPEGAPPRGGASGARSVRACLSINNLHEPVRGL